MIKQGSIQVFDKSYNYMYNLDKTSFFGEYKIMFGLYSNMYYRVSNDDSTHYSMIFNIKYNVFMKEILKDINTFKHLY